MGHWELMGVVAEQEGPIYPEGFPEKIVGAFRTATGYEVLGNYAASGTAVLDELGVEHMRSGQPILYTSGDSVFQLAAHERVLAVNDLYELCAKARRLLSGEHAVGRVIARPFTGSGPGRFVCLSSQRKDYPLSPPRPTALEHLLAAGVRTRGIGKINDIFGGRGIGAYEKIADNAHGIDAIHRSLINPPEPFVMANLVDFDTLYGHRNDAVGYAAALEELDQAVPIWLETLPDKGMLVLTADDGNDPTWPGTDHTREGVPLLAIGHRVRRSRSDDSCQLRSRCAYRRRIVSRRAELIGGALIKPTLLGVLLHVVLDIIQPALQVFGAPCQVPHVPEGDPPCGGESRKQEPQVTHRCRPFCIAYRLTCLTVGTKKLPGHLETPFDAFQTQAQP